MAPLARSRTRLDAQTQLNENFTRPRHPRHVSTERDHLHFDFLRLAISRSNVEGARMEAIAPGCQSAEPGKVTVSGARFHNPRLN